MIEVFQNFYKYTYISHLKILVGVKVVQNVKLLKLFPAKSLPGGKFLYNFVTG